MQGSLEGGKRKAPLRGPEAPGEGEENILWGLGRRLWRRPSPQTPGKLHMA